MCTETICKILLYILNVAFFIIGAAVLTVGIIAMVRAELIYDFVGFLTGTLSGVVKELDILTSINLSDIITDNAIILVVVGSVVFGIGFFGCCGACRKNACCLTIYAIIVAIICAAQIGLGVYAYVEADKLESNIKDGLTIALTKSYRNGLRFDTAGTPVPSTKGEEIAWDFVQIELECCAVNNHTDYLGAALWNSTYYDVPGESAPLQAVVPPTCCKVKDKTVFPDEIDQLEFVDLTACMTSGDAASTEQTGCYYRLRDLFESNQTIVIAVFCIIVVVEVIAIAAALILKSKAESK